MKQMDIDKVKRRMGLETDVIQTLDYVVRGRLVNIQDLNDDTNEKKDMYLFRTEIELNDMDQNGSQNNGYSDRNYLYDTDNVDEDKNTIKKDPEQFIILKIGTFCDCDFNGMLHQHTINQTNTVN